jgi:hypothetical protein
MILSWREAVILKLGLIATVLYCLFGSVLVLWRMKHRIKIVAGIALTLSFFGWGFRCTHPFWMSGEIGYGVAVPADVRPIIERDIASKKILISANREFSWGRYFEYFFLRKKPSISSPLALTFDEFPNQVTVGDGMRTYEYVADQGSWSVYKHGLQGLVRIEESPQ